MLIQYPKRWKAAFCIYCICAVQLTFAQTPIQNTLSTSAPANFGVDGDIKSGILSFDTTGQVETETDDWFVGLSGQGVIDVSDLTTISKLAAGLNISAQFRMSQPNNSTINGNLWLDAVYLRDQYALNNEKDMTVFGNGENKNYDNPTSWAIKTGNVPPKNDIIDVYGHLRRDSNQSDLWVFGAVSTRTQNGDNYIDFEYFRQPVTYTSPSSPGAQGTLQTEGLECGHTAYQFDTTTGDILVNGDFILSINYVNGGRLAEFRFYAWIDSNNIKGLDGNSSSLTDADFKYYNEHFSKRRFDFGDGMGGYEFYNCNNDSKIPYGYARISLRNDMTAEPIVAQDNTGAVVDAPSWGTIGPDGNVNGVYVSPTFIEFGLNATVLGLDGSLSNGICSGSLGTVIIKSRASASFTAELKDLAGPFNLGGTPDYAVTISEPELLTCAATEITLTASTSPAGTYTYEWFKDGQPFDDASPSNDTLNVTEPGDYSVHVAISDGCKAESNVVTVLQNTIEPVVEALGGVIECSLHQIQLHGTISSINPNADLTFEWSGPNDFVNTTELNPYVTFEGTYILTVTDENNGCENIANAVVTRESETTLQIECPPMIEVQCSEDIPVPDLNAIIIIDSEEGSEPVIEFVDDVSDNGSCPEIITRTYSATDACGNRVYCTQIIAVNDTINPEITDIEDYQLEGCNTEWPEFLTTTWSDNCSNEGEIESDQGVDDGSNEDGCVQYRLYTFTITDRCGNSDTETTRVGKELYGSSPELIDVADYMLEGCNAEWPEFLTTTWTGNCSNGGEIESDQGVDDGNSEDGCVQYRLYTFTITDRCGNSDTETTRVSKELYGSAPELVDVADYILEGCNAEWPEFLTTTWSDNCSNEGEIESDQGVDDGSNEDGCTQYRLYTFTITDRCGNSDTETTRVGKELYGSAPELVDVADYILEGCNAEWPEFLTTTWADNCSNEGEIESDQGVDDGNSEDGCVQYRLYTFTITDGCGNSDTETTQVSREYDETNPEITDIEDYLLEGCNTPWPDYLITNWTDNCSQGGEIESDSGVDNGSSPDGALEYRLYTFEVMDSCGNKDIETTLVSREISSGGKIIGNDIELCRDYGEFNLFFLLPDEYIPGGSWSLDASPEGNDLEVSDSGTIFVFEELPYGDYVFLYHQGSGECLPLIEVTIHLLEDQPPCVLACEFRVTKVTTALTPNGDHVNDTFYSGLVPSESCSVDVLIFNRWGAKVFEAINYKNDWDGTVPSNALGSSNRVTTGSYYYILKYKIDGHVEQTVAGYFYVATE
ncbi:gliding motility-associated C-terminal domain-containing protein [Flavobacteriaceae bacterium LMO-SS05]